MNTAENQILFKIILEMTAPRRGGLARRAARMAAITARRTITPPEEMPRRSSRLVAKTTQRAITLSELNNPIMCEPIQMEEIDKNFNPSSPIILKPNQCPDCGVKVGSGRMPCHSRMHTQEEAYVCQIPNEDGTDCHKPCITKDKKGVKNRRLSWPRHFCFEKQKTHQTNFSFEKTVLASSKL